MTPSPSATFPPPRRRYKRALVGGIAGVALLAGGVVAVGQTPWWGCHVGTRAGNSSLEYELASNTAADEYGAAVQQIESVPGVNSLLGEASFDHDVRLAAGSEGDLLVSDYPYFGKRNEFHDASLNPTTGETLWSRGHAGQAALPDVVGDQVLAFAGVDGGIYRLSILDGSDGSVEGCIDLDRIDRAGIGRAAAGVSTDRRTVVLATPTERGSAVSAFGLEDREQLWNAALPAADGTVTWFSDTVVVDQLDSRDVYGVGPILWGNDDERTRASITGLDAETGAESWTWPKDLSQAATQEAGSTVPFVDGPDDIVVVSALTFEGDDPSSRFVGLDETTGDELWSVDTTSMPWAQGFGSTVLALSNGELFALDASSGEEIWRVPVTGGASGPRPDTAQRWGDDVIVATGDGITIVDLATGELVETPVENAWALRLTVTDDTLAVVRDDGSNRTELLTFSRDT